MTDYLDDSSQASHPVGISLSAPRYRRLRGVRGWFWGIGVRLIGMNFARYLREHLEHGDARPALVVSIRPLRVAAYTDELDCVVMLRFPDWLVEEHELRVGSRLLAVFTYPNDEKLAPDLTPGDRHTGRYHNACPQIAEFLSDDHAAIKSRKRQIAKAEWHRCVALANAYQVRFGGQTRDGMPLMTQFPAK